MDEYTPLNLNAFHNAGLALLGEQGTAPIGPQQFRGLPFLAGTDPQRCFVAFGDGLQSAPLSIPIDESARSVIVAHRLTAWGQLPFRAVPDQSDSLPARYEGRFDEAGERQAEVNQAAARGYYLCAWQNPHPEQALAVLTVIPAGPRFLVAGITMGHCDEYPFVRSGARPLKMTITDPVASARPFDLAVAVDRGVTTFPYPLPQQSPEEFLADPLAGWGEELNEQSSPASVEIAALPSATVTVTQGSEVLGMARWEEIEKKKVVELPRVRLELLDTGRNWVRTAVVDDETGQPVPCRVHFRSPDGIPYQPHGHHSRV